MLRGKRIGIIGCGNMGEVLIKGILAKRLLPKKDIIGCDQSKERRAYIGRKFNIKMVDSNPILVSESDVIILAIKPQDIDELLIELARAFNPGQSVISIAAGITTRHIERFIKAEISVIRVMPNSPALVNQAISALSYGRRVKENDKIAARSVFSSLGEVVEVDEKLMDVVTAISGSGPAYFFLIIEYLTDIGVKFGLAKEVASKLALQTALGSAKMAIETRQDPGWLREKVTSRGGTTAAALSVFKEMGLEKIYTKAIRAAIDRSKELSG